MSTARSLGQTSAQITDSVTLSAASRRVLTEFSSCFATVQPRFTHLADIDVSNVQVKCPSVKLMPMIPYPFNDDARVPLSHCLNAITVVLTAPVGGIAVGSPPRYLLYCRNWAKKHFNRTHNVQIIFTVMYIWGFLFGLSRLPQARGSCTQHTSEVGIYRIMFGGETQSQNQRIRLQVPSLPRAIKVQESSSPVKHKRKMKSVLFIVRQESLGLV